MARPRGRQATYSDQYEAQAEGIDGNAPLLDLDDEDGDLLSQVDRKVCMCWRHAILQHCGHACAPDAAVYPCMHRHAQNPMLW